MSPVLCNYRSCITLWNDGYVDRLTYYGAIDPPNTTRVHYIIEAASFGIALIRSDYMYYVKYVITNEELSRLET